MFNNKREQSILAIWSIELLDEHYKDALWALESIKTNTPMYLRMKDCIEASLHFLMDGIKTREVENQRLLKELEELKQEEGP